MRATWMTMSVAGFAAVMLMAGAADVAVAQGNVLQATLGETNQKTGEASTEDVRRILADGSAVLIDSRKRSEYVAGHIAGANNAAPEAGAPAAAFVAEVLKLTGGDKSEP